ncbi:unnamed protein product [Triticum turgidum subsp. durum]|uniref:Receptor kinase-like protein Xa21 n=1 Tax=Triticum turgidum subsp. durum TaxID=4567 RepID=A0A9R0YBG5_TRITD|nr:unnamed protein product [Triticum turgidum subsp. durum]
MEVTTVGQLLLWVLVAYSAHYVVGGRSLYANETDRLSLLQFKDAISLDPHQAFMSWNNSIHFCNWEGVLCRVKTLPHRVSSLNLTSRGLVGHISPSLGNLSFLQSLALVENTLTGEIPPFLGHLRRLRILRLRKNMLQGRIPSFANCSKLRVLDVSYNNLVGQFPTELPPGLQVLRVGTNNLTGTIPASLVNITTLTTISCLNNQIKGNIPSEFADLQSLQYLYAGGNQLAGSFPQAILNLSTLIDLDLGLNCLSGDLPPNLCTALHNLQTLFLGGNIFIGGHIPSSISNASNLYDVDFSSNNFTGLVPTTIGKLTQLSSLNLEKNQLQAHSREEWEFLDSLGNSTDLQMFSISRNRLSGHVPNSLGVVPEWIGSIKILQQLGLEENFFTGVIPSSLSNLSQLGELYLSSNQFIGHIPASFGNFLTLQNLDISNNNLHDGQLPTDIGNAKQLIHLVLSSNKLSGDIPETLGDCESLEDIELDSNIFGGSIPSSLDHITSLKFLNCSSNNLTGSIPLSLGNLQHLEKLDLSFNYLHGEVPAKGIFKNATAIRIEGNKGLCGGASELHMQACVVTPSNSTINNESLVLKVVIPITSIVLLAMVMFGILIWRGKHKSKSISQPLFGTKFPKVSFSDLARATQGFSTCNLIGGGRYSSVYRGKLVEDEIEVAVKVFNLETRGAHKSFIAECNVLRNVRHRNLVPILTACSSIDSTGNDFKALVYEFMPRGDLHNLLYSTRDYEGSSDLDLLTMSQRMSIAVDVADAMEYLHHNNQGTMVHCDLKPSNILLDDNMTAHVGDFGLVRFKVGSATSSLGNPSSSSVGLMGTIGYAAPEYAGGGQVSTAADVYSFGVVLLEIFLRRRPTGDIFKDGLSIVKLTEINFPDRVMEIVDPQLIQELEICQETPTALKEKGVRSLLYMLNVGLSCTKPSPHERTNMQEVVAKLHGIRDAYLRGN